MNSDLIRKALEKVGNPNVLVNLVSRRVRQLNTGGGGMGRPLVSDTIGLGVADIALVAYTRLAPEGGFDLAAFPAVRAWVGRVESELGLEALPALP